MSCKNGTLPDAVLLEALSALEAVNADSPATLVPYVCARGTLTSFQQIWCGVVTFELPSGWRIDVFNDCCSWDYIEEITTPQGVTYNLEPGGDLFNWTPATRHQELGWNDAFPERTSLLANWFEQ